MSYNLLPQEESDPERILMTQSLIDHRLTVEDLLPETKYGKSFFAKVELGVSIQVAAASLKVTPDEVLTWYSRGQEDYSSGDPEAEQSPYASFYARTIQAIAKMTGLSEARVAAENPERYLQRGSASKLIGAQWEEPRNLQHVQHNNTVVNIQDNSQANVIEIKDLPDLLRIMEETGLTGKVLEADPVEKKTTMSNKDELIANRDQLASPDQPTGQDMLDLGKLMRKGNQR